MRIKTKTNSPTVIVIEQGTMDEDKNSLAAKRMDGLERKLDLQYKAFTDKKDYINLIERMQKSFMSSLDKVVSANKAIVFNVNNKRINALRTDFKTAVGSFKNQDSNSAILKSFAFKLNTLNKAIKNINVSPSVKVVNKGPSLVKSFDTLFARMETLIRNSGPRMIPSPS